MSQWVAQDICRVSVSSCQKSPFEAPKITGYSLLLRRPGSHSEHREEAQTAALHSPHARHRPLQVAQQEKSPWASLRREHVPAVDGHQDTHREGEHTKKTWHGQGPAAGWPQGWGQTRVLPSSSGTRGLLPSTRSLTWSSAGLPRLGDRLPPLTCPGTTSFCLL